MEQDNQADQISMSSINIGHKYQWNRHSEIEYLSNVSTCSHQISYLLQITASWSGKQSCLLLKYEIFLCYISMINFHIVRIDIQDCRFHV
jgi:hypothetical protein